MVNTKTVLVGIGIFAVLGLILGAIMYNGLIGSRNNVDNKETLIGVEVQAQADTLPNMVTVANAGSKLQKDLVLGNAEAREANGKLLAAIQAYNDARNNSKDPESLKIMEKSLRDAQSSFSIIMNVRGAESVPKADLTLYTQLNNGIETSQRLIAKYRKEHTDAVTEYNNKLDMVPTSWIGSFYGFKKATYFAPDEDAKKTPKINLSV
jgi:LemA protein